jgi:hypothetical protein
VPAYRTAHNATNRGTDWTTLFNPYMSLRAANNAAYRTADWTAYRTAHRTAYGTADWTTYRTAHRTAYRTAQFCTQFCAIIAAIDSSHWCALGHTVVGTYEHSHSCADLDAHRHSYLFAEQHAFFGSELRSKFHSVKHPVVCSHGYPYYYPHLHTLVNAHDCAFNCSLDHSDVCSFWRAIDPADGASDTSTHSSA